MASLMEGDGTLLLGCHDLCLLLQSADYAVYGREEILLCDRLLVGTCRYKGCLIADIGYVRTGETWSLAREKLHVEIGRYLNRAEMNLEDCLALIEVRKLHVNLPVETSRTQQSLVEHVDTVRSCEDDDTRVRAETVHLCQQGVQRVLTLIIAAHTRIVAACPSDSVYLVYEYDAWGFCLRLCEKVTDTRGTDSDEHLHKIRA